MKVVKKIGFIFLALLVISAIGGYLFFENKFTPPPNYLTLSTSSNNVEITWAASKNSPKAAILLPIKFDGIPERFYMQFDTGSPTTQFYKNRLASILAKYPTLPEIDSISLTSNQSFKLGDMSVSSEIFNVFDRGLTPIDWSDTTAHNIIGSIGADMIEKKITVMDFKNNSINFKQSMPKSYSPSQLQDFSFVKRKVLLPATVGNKRCKLLHDTGTSGFELITNKETWEKMAKKGASPIAAFKVNSWGNSLTAYNIESDQVINFGMSSIQLAKVTHIDGASLMQIALMHMTGMGGMIGNELFMNKILTLDCKNEKYIIND